MVSVWDGLLQLQPDLETTKVLSQTIEQYTWSFNAVCKHGWENDLANGVELHKATYYDHRAITGLPSQWVCAARVKATEALKSAKRLKKRGKTVSCPTSKRCPQYLNWKNTSADLLQDRKGRWWLHVVMEFETPETVATDEVVGVDLGIASPAVDSRGSKYGSKHWQEIEDRTFELRRRLQSIAVVSSVRT
jgi:transposase